MADEMTPARWPALLSTEALAEYTGLSSRTIEKLRAAGELPKPVRMPGDLRSTRWRRSDIDDFLAHLPAEKH